MASHEVYCFLLVILCCVHSNPCLRVTHATSGRQQGNTSNGSILTATTTSSSHGIHSDAETFSVGINSSSIHSERETKTQQGGKITPAAERSSGPAESGSRTLPAHSSAADLLSPSTVSWIAAAPAVKSNGVRAESNGGQEEEKGGKKERKGWPSIRNCNYTYQADGDVVDVSCVNHESGNSGGDRVRDMNPGSRESSVNQLSFPAPSPTIPDLSIHTPSSSPSDRASSSTQSHPKDAAESATTTATTTSVPATGTSLTIDLLISGFPISSLNQSVFDILSIDWLNNRTGREYRRANIRSLILSNNSINTMRDDWFQQLPAVVTSSIQHLDLSHNLIRKLKAETFDTLHPTLSSLVLSFNLLESIDFLSSNASGVRHGISRITHLDLSHNRLRVIGESCFPIHSLLRYINLSGNMIDSIDAGSFVSLSHLSHLDLSHNPLRNHGDKLILSSMSHSLQVINLSNTSRNRSERIPAGIDPFVRRLILSHNQVSLISLGDLEDHNSLTCLDLSHNQVREVEQDALGRLGSLRELRLDQNLLSSVPQRLPSHLLLLSLDQNSITSLPDSSFASLSVLQSLNLAGNQITNMHPDSLKGLNQLKQLNLSGNKISDLSYSLFHDCSQLHQLDISHNPIMHLSSYTFTGLASLSHLILSHIPANESMIKIDSDTFTPLVSVRILDLSHSPGLFRTLLHADQDVDHLKPLQSLTSVQQINLQYNQIPELSQQDVDPLQKWIQERGQQGILKTISLQEVEWKCDHSVHWLIRWIKSLRPRMSFASSPSSSASPLHDYSVSSSQPSRLLLLISSSSSAAAGPETMASATNSSSRSRITLGSKDPLMQLTSLPPPPPPSTFIAASASLASTSDLADTSSRENEVSTQPETSAQLDHVTDIICSSPEDLRGRSLLSLTEQEMQLQSKPSPHVHQIERGMTMDQNSGGTHPSSLSTSEPGITATAPATTAKSEEKSSSPSSLSLPPS